MGKLFWDATMNLSDPATSGLKYLRADGAKWMPPDSEYKFLSEDWEWEGMDLAPTLPPDLSTAANVLQAAQYAKTDPTGCYNALKNSLTDTIHFGSLGSAQFRLIGVDHDMLTSGGKAQLTFLAEECTSLSAMGPNKANAGGYIATGTTMQAHLSSLYAAMDSDWKALVSPVDKVCSTSQSATTTMHDNYLWLPSAAELAINYSSYFSPKEGDTYAYFSGESGTGSSTKRVRHYNGAAQGYDTRSCYYNNVYYIFITDAGARNVSNTTTKLGVVPGFCVAV